MPLTYGGKKLKLSVGTRPHPLSIALEFSVGQAGRGEIHRVAAGEYEIVSIPATNECVQVPAGGPWWKALCKMEQCNFGKDTCHKVDFDLCRAGWRRCSLDVLLVRRAYGSFRSRFPLEGVVKDRIHL